MRPGLSEIRAYVDGSPADLSGPAVYRLGQTLRTATIITANVVGALVVVVLAAVILPLPKEADGDLGVLIRNLAAAAAYVAIIVPVGRARGLRYSSPATDWLLEDRSPSAAERDLLLRLPQRLLLMQMALWGAAVVIFAALNLTVSLLFAFEIAITVALGGATTTSVSYLLDTRLGRLATAKALADVPPAKHDVPGVAFRAIFSWALGTGISVAGALTFAVFTLFVETDARQFAAAVIFLCTLALVVGFGAMFVFARSIADPLETLRDALGRVAAGDLEAEVPVYDATEVGFVQAGFNEMVAGLRERERVRDLFGRHVGEDVARRALEEGVTLGGEEREAVALFIDIIGSTSFAAERSPTEVVSALNDFFTVVVEVTRKHRGLVNKFEGDAALCIFGAPLPLDDAAGAALAAAREMRTRLEAEVDGITAAIGVSAGNVVAGNVGAADRFEYTVIGDPVNEAARLTELAKERPGRLLASEAVLRRAGPSQAGDWELADEVQLRGRTEPTRLAVPRGDG